MKNLPYAYITDHFQYSRFGNRTVIGLSFDGLDKTFNPQIGDAIILLSPNDEFCFVTNIKGVERWATIAETKWTTCSLWIEGFIDNGIDFTGWFVIIFPKHLTEAPLSDIMNSEANQF